MRTMNDVVGELTQEESNTIKIMNLYKNTW